MQSAFEYEESNLLQLKKTDMSSAHKVNNTMSGSEFTLQRVNSLMTG